MAAASAPPTSGLASSSRAGNPQGCPPLRASNAPPSLAHRVIFECDPAHMTIAGGRPVLAAIMSMIVGVATSWKTSWLLNARAAFTQSSNAARGT
eukprot:CAMPEP_0182861254 /NCGR_PEP_ID=MMETSP0034_2-20130328/5392_1 /TAXON_ID=156128 /ORGANISM="Nephroselmis pyriformis, Strain CCMP717" /LENGTH=94 /DNA_ID=CAMNT_0024993163 /DNA_START=52 /DNA_END=336 /DNA_ORIENTATION=-